MSRVIYLVCQSGLDTHAYGLLLASLDWQVAVATRAEQNPQLDRVGLDLAVAVADRPLLGVRRHCHALRAATPGLPLLVLTRGHTPALRTAWLQLQPTGLLGRAAGLPGLRQALQTISTGGVYLDPGWNERAPAHSSIPLSRREHQLRALLRAGWKLRHAALHMGISYKTADTYRTRLFRKLHVRSRVELIRQARSP